ncbi:MAG: restriction endonuclease [Actinomycetota bacterium]|nr:restriction endonuclease [Actinomycetota bacterium]
MDETQQRLLGWANGQHSERLAAQVLLADGYKDLDPSHPYGGPDGGRDGVCTRDGNRWVMAVYFPRGQVTVKDVENKLRSDIEGALKHDPHGVVFVTNQEMTLSQRSALREVSTDVEIEIYHMERVATVLDQPAMHSVRKKYLHIDADKVPLAVTFSVTGEAHALTESDALREKLCEVEEGSIRQRARESRERKPPAWGLPSMLPNGIGGYAPDPGPTSEEDEDREVADMRDTARAKWPDALEFLEARSFSGVQFRVANSESAFLTRVRVTAKFHNAYGLEPMKTDGDFFRKVLDPDYVAPAAFGFSRSIDVSAVGMRFKNNPVHFNHHDGDLEVTIDLDSLRPPPDRGFTSRADEVIVIGRKPGAPVHVTWFVTAETYGTPQHGEPFELPTHTEDATRVFVRTLEQATRGDN